MNGPAPSTLPATRADVQQIDIDAAKLPATYERAVSALTECTRLDECQRWANQAEALASYAKQSKDESLRKMADRIQARAIRRCGELYNQIPAGSGGRPAKNPEGRPPELTRAQAAKAAGQSQDQRKTAQRVAAVPQKEFEAAVESAKPPTVTQLAERGKQPQKTRPLVDLEGIPPADYARATEAQSNLRRFAQYCEKNDPVRIAHAFKRDEAKEFRKYVAIVDNWLDRFVTNLKE